MTSPTPLTRFEVADHIATLTLNNPSKRNAIEFSMRAELRDTIRTVRDDASVRALIITGAGDHFCSGGDLRSTAGSNLDNAGWRERMNSMHSWMRELIALDRPVIAAVDGFAYGAGFSLALAADFIVASTRARFCMSFMRVGLIPDYGAYYTLPRVVGAQRAKELMLSARELDAQEALRLGIALELVPPEALQARALALAQSLVQASPVGVGLIKRALAANTDSLDTMLDLESAGQAVAGGTVEHKQAVQRFLDKQPPNFVWPK